MYNQLVQAVRVVSYNSYHEYIMLDNQRQNMPTFFMAKTEVVARCSIAV